MKICIFGPGAIGGFLAVKLANSGIEVSVVARGENLKSIVANGIQLDIDGRIEKAKVKATKTNKNIISKGYFTSTSTKNVAVIKITKPTIKVFVAPAPTKARTISKVDIGAAKIS